MRACSMCMCMHMKWEQKTSENKKQISIENQNILSNKVNCLACNRPKIKSICNCEHQTTIVRISKHSIKLRKTIFAVESLCISIYLCVSLSFMHCSTLRGGDIRYLFTLVIESSNLHNLIEMIKVKNK